MDLNVRTIRLFDNKKEFLLSERTAGAVLSFSKFSDGLEETNLNSIYRASVIVEDGLQINMRNLKWYQFIQKFFISREIGKKNLITKLTSKQILELAKEVLILEGFKFDEVKKPDSKKKVK